MIHEKKEEKSSAEFVVRGCKGDTKAMRND
jgi:hypothetical protein